MLTAVVAAPGVAWAEEPAAPAPGAALEETLGSVLGQVAGGAAGGSEAPALPLPVPGFPQESAPQEPAPGGEAAAGGEEGPLPPAPPELLGALQSLLTPLGVPDTCVQGVADGVEDLLNGILSQDPQAVVEDLVGGLESALTGLASGQPPALDPAVLGVGAADVAADVQALLAAFQACLPALPGSPEEPPAPPAQPAPEAPQAAPVSAPVAEQPAQYLGYAPTGGGEGVETEGPGTAVPLAVLGGLLVAGGTGAAVSRARSRAVGR
ncbi:hypothetical protein SAMN06273567_11457 [Geodermatophilus aquaeductus]|uniref:Uncharacterized protein n=1 Tax=Geodermatophilus aquaeductus TaxID=1564161 RepID=A0A521FRD6_9ACTN|nr:hypothetical protein [Geodermatophilus aquaeductus]SMO98787.1 hypothetical protein SAMN06273567_11457 [Geodermatophilus aquaeductus]